MGLNLEEQRFQLISQAIDGFVTTIRTGLVVAGFVAIGYYIQNVLVAFAGQQTEAAISFSLVTKLQADRWFAYMVGAGGLGYGLMQRKLRQRNIRRLTVHTSELESRMHPKRTSSGLTPEGKTRKEDR